MDWTLCTKRGDRGPLVATARMGKMRHVDLRGLTIADAEARVLALITERQEIFSPTMKSHLLIAVSLRMTCGANSHAGALNWKLCAKNF
jgi:hypothetical protein